MSRVGMPIVSVGNEFAFQYKPLHLATSVVASEVAIEPVVASPIAPVVPLEQPHNFSSSADTPSTPTPPKRFMTLLHQYSLAAFALLFLLVAGAGIEVGGRYWSAHTMDAIKPAQTLPSTAHPIAGLNVTVPNSQLQVQLRNITTQPATLTVGDQTVPISSDTIRSWLQINASTDKSQDYIHIKPNTIATSLTKLANQFVKAPINEVTVNEAGVDQVVVAGRAGTALSNPNTLKTQAQQVAKTVMDAKGLQFSTPLQTTPAQAVTPAAFGKLLDANIVTKQMYAYENGQLVRTFSVSAGAPATPTPVGEFHIYAKYVSQDMSGYNVNGTKYFQPRVPWVNYFTGADAVHGVYWHPLSWFGAINSSHGCVGVPVSDGEWIYDWAPIGTTVITHA